MLNSSENALLASYKGKVLKALTHLEYSAAKVQALSPGPKLSEEDLETWESFAARLARVVDIFLTKYLKLRVRGEDPAFDGSLRDYCALAEKLGWIDDADAWVALRELRNSTAHEYEDADLVGFHQKLRVSAPRVIKLKKWLKSE